MCVRLYACRCYPSSKLPLFRAALKKESMY